MKSILLSLLLLFAVTAAFAQENKHGGRRAYVGVGVKAFFNDRTSTVIDARATLGNYFSLRPDLIFNKDYVTPQIALSADGRLTRWWWLYAGGGGAYNNDGDENLQPYLTAGTDMNLPLRLTLRLSGQVLFRPGDTDTGGMITLNFRL
jgi:hypothetical protein